MPARVGRVVLLHPDVNFDGTFRSLSLCAQVVFLRLLPFLDDAGRLPPEKGIGLTANIHHRLGLPPADVEAAVSELLERQMVQVEGDALSVPKFAQRQRDAAFLLPPVLGARLADAQSVRDFVMALAPLFERAGLRLLGAQEVSAPSPEAPAPRTVTAPRQAAPEAPRGPAPTGEPRRARGGRTEVPRVEGETDEEFAKRLRSLRNARYYRAASRPDRLTAEASASEPSDAERLNQTSDGKTSDVRRSDAVQTVERLNPRASDFGSELSSSETTATTAPSLSSPPSLRAGREEDVGSVRRQTPAGSQTPEAAKTPKTVPSIQTVGASKTYVPRPAPPSHETMLGDEVAQEISRASAGLFLTSASTAALRELGRANALLGQQGARPDRWKVFGEYILAGGYAALHERRFKRRLRGEIVMVPDLDMLIKTVSAATPEGGQANEMDTSRLMRGINSAIVWDEQGRPDLRVRGADSGRGGLARVAAPSDAQGRRAGDELARAGATGSSAGGAVGLSGAAADDLLEGILGSGSGAGGAGA